MKLSTTTEATFNYDIQGDNPVLVKFTAPWCGPCQRLTPHLERLADDLAGHLKILILNVDESRSLAEKFGIRGIPTMILFVKGKAYAHLNEFTTLRMRIQIDKLFNELGIIPEDNLLVSEQNESGCISSKSHQWRAFNGDETKKADCLTRLCRERDDNKLNSACLAGGSGNVETVVGIPGDFSELLDALSFGFRYLSGVSGKVQIRSRFSALVNAIPVGANLAGTVSDFLYHLIYVSDWQIKASTLNSDDECHLFAQMSALHQREWDGVPVSRNEWEPLQRTAISVCRINEAPFDAFEMLAVPINEWSWVPLNTLNAIFHLNQTPQEWERADHEKLNRLDEAAHEQVSKELTRLQTQANVEEITAWGAQRQERLNIIHQQQRNAEPEFWARYDAMKTRHEENQLCYYAFLSDMLVNQLQALKR